MKKDVFPGHIKPDGTVQTVEEHLRNVSEIAAGILKPIGLGQTGKLAGLLHDAGKYTQVFADYIKKAAAGERVRRGSVNHTFAGVRYMLESYHKSKPKTKKEAIDNIASELISVAMGAHHGQFDCVNQYGESGFAHRLEAKIPYDEAMENFFRYIPKGEIDRLFVNSAGEMKNVICKMNSPFYTSMLYRTVLSALIEADRRDTADFLIGANGVETEATRELWKKHLQMLKEKLAGFSTDGEINKARGEISRRAEGFADFPADGIYRMSVPTGGGKTLSSLRAALAHAARYDKRRVIFVVPLLSILEQNAAVLKNALADDSIVLEHHSNVVNDSRETGTELNGNELITESWHSPVIITTLVQLLNTLFDGRPSRIRRMHALINSTVIIDEVQTVPRKMLSLFNEAVNYLATFCCCAVILCSATQPCFEQLEAHRMNKARELIVLEDELRKVFKRTEISDMTRPPKGDGKIAAFALENCKSSGSVLVVCNKRDEARQLYLLLKDKGICVCHLSASMCMKHRTDVVNEMKACLKDKKPLVCVSTQVIEAGVDISFGCVIRYAAGLDNIVQAAGRCNRGGEYGACRTVYCVNRAGENLSHLVDIEKSKNAALELFCEYEKDPKRFSDSLQSDRAVEEYYKRLYGGSERSEYDYPLKDSPTLYEMLVPKMDGEYFFTQAFKTAGDLFEVFDGDTHDVIVPYGEEGVKIAEEFRSEKAGRDLQYRKELVQRSKPYTVSIYSYELKKLLKNNALEYVCEKAVILLDADFYDGEAGLVTEAEMKFLEM